jgi:hypothetical protein
MLPLTGYGGEVRHLRQASVEWILRESLASEDEAALASEPALDEGRTQRRRPPGEGVLVVPQGE